MAMHMLTYVCMLCGFNSVNITKIHSVDVVIQQ